MKVTGAQNIRFVYFPINFALSTALYHGTNESSDVLVCGFQICVNQWKLAFRNEHFRAAFTMGRKVADVAFF
jgi:hypothetical protein